MSSSKGNQLLREGQYAAASDHLEQEINNGEPAKELYWYLGLSYLLNGSEEEAQMAWFFAQADESFEQAAGRCLPDVLLEEANWFAENHKDHESWLIYRHLCELVPEAIEYQIKEISLALKIGRLDSQRITAIIESDLLKGIETFSSIQKESLIYVLDNLVKQKYPLDDSIITFIKKISTQLTISPIKIKGLQTLALFTSYTRRRPDLGSQLSELCVELADDNKSLKLEILKDLAPIQQNMHRFDEGIASARHALELSEKPLDKLICNSLLLRGITSAGGHWEESVDAFYNHKTVLKSTAFQLQDLSRIDCLRIPGTLFFIPHFEDDPKENRALQNSVMSVFQNSLLNILSTNSQDGKIHRESINRKLKIGYLSHCFKKHSVGWLARWLLVHHSRDDFELYLYSVNHGLTHDTLTEMYRSYADQFREMGTNGQSIAKQIREDEVDILIDLDSITLDVSCEVMALKPAPVQATWLGLDASGLPSIDYFIADNYVLPDDAEDYYSEKIWRLPNCYLSVDGFEVGVPTATRASLDIPEDAVVFFTAQRGFKRHADTARMQLKILKEVRNSYLCIKGLADQVAIQEFFKKLAAEEGVPTHKLKFMPMDPSEQVHRANLKIADVVLDTFPYNGATTTMEVLWMELPIITLVGKQFAARNSYTMLVNAGVKEGIAWTPEEYIQWGVRMGNNSELRKDVAWKLRQAKQGSPLWNAKQFAAEMESAYKQMWKKHVESKNR